MLHYEDCVSGNAEERVCYNEILSLLAGIRRNKYDSVKTSHLICARPVGIFVHHWKQKLLAQPYLKPTTAGV